MQNSCLDKRVVHPLGEHRINHGRFCKGVVPMEIPSNAELLIIGKTKVYIVPPDPMTKEELERRLNEVRAAGWAIIEEMVAKNLTGD